MNHESEKKQNKTELRLTRRGKIFLGATALSLAAAGLYTLESAVDEPTYSKDTVSEMVTPGDTLWDIAQEVEGADTVDTRDIVHYISEMPENADVLEDGVLDQGEVIVRPDHIIE